MFVNGFVVLTLFLQVETGSILGSGAPAAAEVALADPDGTEILQTKADQAGSFLLAGVAPGAYDLKLSDYTIHIQVRAGCESVVEGREQKPFELWSCEVDQFDRDRIETFPVARNIWNLLQTQHPATVTENIGQQTGILQLFSVHGGLPAQNSYRWDGVNITNPYEPGKPLTFPMFGMLQELRVVPASGAGIEMASRRAGETFRGEARAFYMKRFPEGEISFGGRVPRREWSYFSSFAYEHLSKVIPDFSVHPTTTVVSGFLRGDAQAGAKDHFFGVISGQSAKHSHLGAQPGVDPAATLLGNDRFELLQGHWVHRENERAISELTFGFSHSSPTDTLQHGVTAPSSTRLSTGGVTGSAPLESDEALSRFSVLGQTQLGRLQAGFDVEESLATEEKRMFNGLQLFLFPGDVPFEVAEFNTPSHAMQRLREISFFAHDGRQIRKRVFIRAGINVDSSHAWLPKQVSGAGVFAPVRALAGASRVISWFSASPQIKIIVPFGGTRISGGYGRYYHLLPASYADFANPTALGGALFQWNDRNQDRAFQPGEEGELLRVFGGPYSSVDPNLKRPFTDEWTFAVERGFGRRVQAGVRLLERESRRLVSSVNVGISPSDRYLLTNPPGMEETYKGVETNVTGRFSNNTYVAVSFNAFKRAYLAKIAAHERIPFGVRLSTIVAYFDGMPFRTNFDQRVSREFQVGSKRLSIMLDVFNVPNRHVENPRVFRFGATFSF